jgi:hypothetical protein
LLIGLVLFHPAYVREKIRTSQLINRLQKCAFGEINLTMTQLRAIEIPLRKSIPDLAAAEIKSEQTNRYMVEVSPVLDRDEWQRFPHDPGHRQSRPDEYAARPLSGYALRKRCGAGKFDASIAGAEDLVLDILYVGFGQ